MSSEILLIDDDRLVRRMYTDHLLSVGHQVDAVATGEAGLDLLGAKRYDVVVTDLVLPGIDGLEVLANARKIDPDVGVIMISALNLVDPAVKAIKAGAFDYLVKPIAPETLRLAVARCADYRSLLWENIDLKRHLALSQSGARIAASTDHDPACHQAAEALAAQTDAQLTLVVTRLPEGLKVRSAVGSGIPLDPAMVEDIDSWLRISEDNRTILLSDDAPSGLLALGRPTSLSVPGPGDAVSVVLFPGEKNSFDDQARRAANFLVKHLGQALNALDKLEMAQNLAYTDDLTQLFNGRYLHRILDQYVSLDDTGGKPFAVLFLDLDHFKAVNDEHGHLVGSELLVEVADVIRRCIRETDTAVRYGGDEYVIVLPESDQGGALRVAERIRQRIEEHVFLSGKDKSIRLTASIGIACHPEHTTDKRQLVELADHAMYRGKRGSRNVVYIATQVTPV